MVIFCPVLSDNSQECEQRHCYTAVSNLAPMIFLKKIALQGLSESDLALVSFANELILLRDGYMPLLFASDFKLMRVRTLQGTHCH